MHTFKAILIKQVSFVSFHGQKRTLPEGAEIEVIQVCGAQVSTDLMGKPVAEIVGEFVGTRGADSFDIDRSEFKTVD